MISATIIVANLYAQTLVLRSAYVHPRYLPIRLFVCSINMCTKIFLVLVFVVVAVDVVVVIVARN